MNPHKKIVWFYKQLKIDITSRELIEDPTIRLVHGISVPTNYFRLLGFKEDEQDVKILNGAQLNKSAQFKVTTDCAPGMAQGFMELLGDIQKDIMAAGLCFKDATGIKQHREFLYATRFIALEHYLRTLAPGVGKRNPSQLRLELRDKGRRLGFSQNELDRAIVELERKVPVGFCNPPVITSPKSASAMVGRAFSYRILATENPSRFSASGLLAGWFLDARSGVISGTPTAEGTLKGIVVKAHNAGGEGNSTLTIKVVAEPPVISSSSKSQGMVKKAFLFQICANNNPARFSVSGVLPPGLAIDEASGLVAGLPTQHGSWKINVEAHNSGGTGSASLEIEVAPYPGIIERLIAWLKRLFDRWSARRSHSPGGAQVPAADTTRRRIAIATSSIVVTGLAILIVPMKSDRQWIIGKSVQPPRCMPGYCFAKVPAIVKVKGYANLWHRLRGAESLAEPDLGRLFDGDPATGWWLVKDGANSPLRVEFTGSRYVEGLVLLNGLRGDEQSRANRLELEFTDGTRRQVQLESHGRWQFVLFEPVQTTSISISALGGQDSTGARMALGELWFLETTGFPETVKPWSGDWKSDKDHLSLAAISGGWFKGVCSLNGSVRAVIVRQSPFADGELVGTIAQGDEFGVDVDAEFLNIRSVGSDCDVVVGSLATMEERLRKSFKPTGGSRGN